MAAAFRNTVNCPSTMGVALITLTPILLVVLGAVMGVVIG